MRWPVASKAASGTSITSGTSSAAAGDGSAGFTGWVRWGVEQGVLRADVHAFATSVSLNAPATLAVGDSTIITGSLTQPDGTVLALDYPLSVHWSGSSNLGTDATFDPATHKLTALHPGAVTIAVTEGGVTAMKTIVTSGYVRLVSLAATAATLAAICGGSKVHY